MKSSKRIVIQRSEGSNNRHTSPKEKSANKSFVPQDDRKIGYVMGRYLVHYVTGLWPPCYWSECPLCMLICADCKPSAVAVIFIVPGLLSD